ncbi:K+-transporting ATPase ATPase C chain [Devosia enhydra]|uniref:Potassium-transporting ATPase KdpC subunit n=1 Tax=Devosia enhydra TaxID=665118 RepID=A0A1K2HZ73_9HYPH|nr:potassium-transporting ATPase subunit KdpC [Devosia enhydra]SFZ85437.1 K+-transporting ATPase ATPase C chain [Devosia enhydra]
MLSPIRPAILLTLAFTLICGIAYPLAITGIGQAALPATANGSPILRDGKIIGSSLVGQAVTLPGYFWPRPSATATTPYNAAASGGANYGPTDARLIARVREAVTSNGGAGTVPADAVTTSASGLDPHISPETAQLQVARVAEARGTPPAEIARLVADMTEGPWLGIFGEPRVNVLALNLALDAKTPLAR